MSEVTRPRVLLADDHPGILKALKRLLASSCEVVGQVTFGGAVLETAVTLRPDIVVIDVTMPGLSGLEACRQIKQAIQGTKVIVMSASIDEDLRDRALELGASAFLSKNALSEDLLRLIHSPIPDTRVIDGKES